MSLDSSHCFFLMLSVCSNNHMNIINNKHDITENELMLYSMLYFPCWGIHLSPPPSLSGTNERTEKPMKDGADYVSNRLEDPDATAGENLNILNCFLISGHRNKSSIYLYCFSLFCFVSLFFITTSCPRPSHCRVSPADISCAQG